MAAPKKVDYERIEPGWRRGLKSAEQLAAEYTADTGVKVSGAAIKKHFSKLGVPRDLAAKVKAKAEAMVLEAGVTGTVSTKTTTKTAAIVDQAALDVAGVQMRHRRAIRETRETVERMVTEARGMEASEKTLLTRSTVIGRMADALTKLVALERQAYKLDEDGEGGAGGIGDLSRPLTDAERASRLAAIIERARQRAQASGEADAGGDAPGP